MDQRGAFPFNTGTRLIMGDYETKRNGKTKNIGHKEQGPKRKGNMEKVSKPNETKRLLLEWSAIPDG